MTADLSGSGVSEPQLVSGAVAHILSPTAGSLHIDAGNPIRTQQYNRFDLVLQAFKALTDNRNFTFDTPKSPPYKRGSHGERGVPKASRVLVTKGFATQMVPLAPLRVSTSGRVFYASSVRKGIRRRRRTSALTFGLAADVFVVASSNKFVLLASVQEDGQSNLVTGSKRFLREAR